MKVRAAERAMDLPGTSILTPAQPRQMPDADEDVTCDGCGAGVDYDAGMAKIVRACGGVVLCAPCTPMKGTSA